MFNQQLFGFPLSVFIGVIIPGRKLEVHGGEIA